MVRIKFDELLKAVKLLEKDSMCGTITIKEDGASLKFLTMDRTNREMSVEISDTNYPMMPRVTKTETF